MARSLTSNTWVNSGGTMLAVPLRGGGYAYYISAADVSFNGRVLENDPVVAMEISKFALEIMEAKR